MLASLSFSFADRRGLTEGVTGAFTTPCDWLRLLCFRDLLRSLTEKVSRFVCLLSFHPFPSPLLLELGEGAFRRF